MSTCELTTEQRMNGVRCGSLGCEPCREFEELNNEYINRNVTELSMADKMVKLQAENKALIEDLKQKDEIIAEHVALNEKLRAKNNKLKECVEFYANEWVWEIGA
jgi:hypothetical protein